MSLVHDSYSLSVLCGSVTLRQTAEGLPAFSLHPCGGEGEAVSTRGERPTFHSEMGRVRGRREAVGGPGGLTEEGAGERSQEVCAGGRTQDFGWSPERSRHRRLRVAL